jgi:Fe-Mn family superoxide dismutase
MNKRNFLKQAVLATVGVYVAPTILLSSCKSNNEGKSNNDTNIAAVTGPFTLPQLTYGYDAFTDVIDAQTMEIHYTKHHQGYTDKLNAALNEAAITGMMIEEILKMDTLPTAIRNNGGGYYNHSLYWDILTPGGNMTDTFKNKINQDFGSKEGFINELVTAGAKRFGSGWAWVVQDADKKLHITSTANQDNPLMKSAELQGTPILGIDVWEHAYYLKYQNKRTEYLNNILKIINWEKVENRMVK